MSFAKNPDRWLRNHEVVNFDIIDNQCRSDKLLKEIKDHQTVTDLDLCSYPEKRKADVISSVYKLITEIFLELELTKRF